MVGLPFDELKTREIDGNPGLITIIAQDAFSGDVLMVAYANKEAIEKTIATGKAHYYSTSRGKIWLKGESSGNVQNVKEIFVDCDGDALIYKIIEPNPACHKGYQSCFYRRIQDGTIRICEDRKFNPEEVYK